MVGNKFVDWQGASNIMSDIFNYGTGFMQDDKHVPIEQVTVTKPAIANTERGTGRSTKQIQAAPSGAFYAANLGSVSYLQTLAKKNGREDLKIIPIRTIIKTTLGVNKYIVADHAASAGLNKRERKRIFNYIDLHNLAISTPYKVSANQTTK